jgi:hypothetical protein
VRHVRQEPAESPPSVAPSTRSRPPPTTNGGVRARGARRYSGI